MIGTSIFVGICSWMMYVHVPEAYMDEIFHFPQTQAYCQHHFGT